MSATQAAGTAHGAGRVIELPRCALVVLSGTLTQFNLPLQGVAVILGVDALMDMARTSLYVVGNCLASVVMARWEGALETVPDLTAGAPGGSLSAVPMRAPSEATFS